MQSCFFFEGFQLFRIFYYRHKKQSFQVGFLSLCFFWNLLRILFFAWLLNTSSKTLIVIAYWVPINIQFATFSLLVVYYAHLHHTQKSEWYALKRRYVSLYIVLNVLFFILAAVWIGLGLHYDQNTGDHDEKEPPWLNKIHSAFTGLVFLLLSCVTGYHGWKAAGLMRHTDYAQPKLVGQISYPRILTIAFLLFLVFTVRCIYDLLLTTSLVQKYVEVEGGISTGAGFTFLIFFSFEIIPCFLVMLLFGHVRSTTLGVFSRSANKAQPNIHNFNRQANLVIQTDSKAQLLKPDLFNNPLRYDSDDENTPFKNSPMPYGTNSPYAISSPIHSLNDDLGS